MKPPLRYFGGKQKMIKFLLPLIPKHEVYVEPFGGAASLLFTKEPSPIEVYNDVDERLCCFFLVLKEARLAAELQRLLYLTPYSREEYRRALAMEPSNALETAWQFFIDSRMSMFGRHNAGWGVVVRESHSGMAGTTSAYLSALSSISACHERFKDVIVLNVDWSEVVERFDSRDTFFYIDPPYMPGTWPHDDDGFLHLFSEEDHKILVGALTSIKGKALVSGYDSEIYRVLEGYGWRRLEIEMRLNASRSNAEGLKKKLEVLWLNYET